MKAWPALLLTFLLLAGCAARREYQRLESADVGLVLLDKDATRPPEAEIEALFDATRDQLGGLPERTRGWLTPLAPALQRLKAETLALARTRPQELQAALAPFRTLGRYPIVYEQVKVPADAELAPVVIEANRQLRQAWRANGALWLAAELEPLLRREMYRLLQRDLVSRAALGVAAASQLHALLQAWQGSEELAAGLEQTQRLAALRLEVLQARLRVQPAQGRILRDDIELVSTLIQSLIRARTELFETRQRIEAAVLAAGDRIDAIDKALATP